ncbi:hypothetical protein HK102_002113 [Quaeritorhiza haematococci]|nr:hypothetical protein HK102_002113 [Quaeritorhiza haematococci]
MANNCDQPPLRELSFSKQPSQPTKAEIEATSSDPSRINSRSNLRSSDERDYAGSSCTLTVRGSVVSDAEEEEEEGEEDSSPLIRNYNLKRRSEVDANEDGEGEVAMGRSSFWQSVLNSVNLLVGVTLLSLPFTLKTGGWLYGISLILFGAISTLYTSLLLVKCMSIDPTIHSFGDIGARAFGPFGRWFISAIYVFELTACTVSYVIVVGDSLNAVWPSVSVERHKVMAFLIMLVTSWVDSMSVLSGASAMGLLASVALLLLTVYDGFSTSEAPEHVIVLI